MEHVKNNWNTIDEKLKNLKYPLSFIYNIKNFQNKIDDYNLSLLLRFFFKNNIELCINYPLFFLVNNLNKDKFKISRNVVFDFYNSLKNKIYFTRCLIEFRDIFQNYEIKLKDLSFSEKRSKINEIIDYFRSHFDCSKSGYDGALKYLNNIKNSFNVYEYIENPVILELKNRLGKIVIFFGKDFFTKRKILLIEENQFDNFSNEEKVKYLLYFFLKTEKYLTNILNCYDLLNIFDNNIKQIVNPMPINISLDKMLSESESEDIDFLI